MEGGGEVWCVRQGNTHTTRRTQHVLSHTYKVLYVLFPYVRPPRNALYVSSHRVFTSLSLSLTRSATLTFQLAHSLSRLFTSLSVPVLRILSLSRYASSSSRRSSLSLSLSPSLFPSLLRRILFPQPPFDKTYWRFRLSRESLS